MEHWWNRIKKRNLLLFISVLIAVFYVCLARYSTWQQSVTSPSEPARFVYSLTPSPNGEEDRFVSGPPISPMEVLTRFGDKQGTAQFLLGPWDKNIKIRNIILTSIVVVPKNSTISAKLKYGDTIEEFEAISDPSVVGEPKYDPSITGTLYGMINVTVVRYRLANPDLMIPYGKEAAIEVVSDNTKAIGIGSDTSIAIDVLQSERGYVQSFISALREDSLIVGLFVTVFAFILQGFLYETDAERRQKDYLQVLSEIRDILKWQR